ncbi:p53-like transcription factor [Bimuria novae-zelandiae CBS 107.79]|uniref:p53-like transcription factor n=1 Tax=Bimuria novae-zelandiae CBS 107.79 TaxID=1447943 RepID=A0A6A5VIT8_9PLEO|nr:p53-like transcription factor [Bimuria novae-zelandiae CBS 107.79]
MNLLQPSLPLASENPFSSEQECLDQIGAHPHHSHFAAGVSDQLRRESTLSQSAAGIPLSSITRTYNPHHPETHYQSSAALSDTGSGSISASPSSNSSSQLAYSLGSQPAYFHNPPPIPHYSTAYRYGTMPSTGRTSRMTEPSASVMLPPARSPGMGNPVSPSMGAAARDNYTTSTPGLSRHPHALSPRYSEVPRYGSLPETPRSVATAAMPLTTSYTNSLMGSYGAQPQPGGETPPFNAQEDYCDIICDGSKLTPTIEAKIEKGFFMSHDGVWTCYRRNYFAVNVYYNLHPWVNNSRLYLNQGGGKPQDQIQALAVSLAAAVDGSTGKTIELIQHTPKRDKGPQLAMKKELLSPTPPGKNHEHASSYGLSSFHQSTQVAGPLLPLQQRDPEPSQQYSPASHTSNSYQHAFERIQFKSATANNGKRRAQQQYYHLLVELWANIQRPNDKEPRWVKVAARSSHPVVVRGRSPSHYSNEGPHNAGTSRGAGSGGGPGQGPHGYSNGTSQYTTGYRTGLSGGGSSGLGGGMYRGTTYSLDQSPMGSHSVSSASTLSGSPVDNYVGDHHMTEDEDTKMIQSHTNYQYYPAPIYEAIQPKVENTIPSALDRRIKEEFPGSAAMGGSWQVGGCGRFQGMETSRGYYPDVQAQHAAGF